MADVAPFSRPGARGDEDRAVRAVVEQGAVLARPQLAGRPLGVADVGVEELGPREV